MVKREPIPDEFLIAMPPEHVNDLSEVAAAADCYHPVSGGGYALTDASCPRRLGGSRRPEPSKRFSLGIFFDVAWRVAHVKIRMLELLT